MAERKKKFDEKDELVISELYEKYEKLTAEQDELDRRSKIDADL
eukprot:CAMPEP_0168614404 /NCGR_PEP_ID=MMETSP0449_2-20121227/3957_1 /TAXON_ID=1082188 /ORGANISM="Strombidium rassoulzadegani, Strain ras09" /LENGTH=43 /DNA_ID= /DNA_START= /DNA_END= /DNA_ORIENTATION=